MIILHTSDWHLGKSLYDFSLLEDQRHFIQWLLDFLRDNPVDALILAGDIYDRPVPSGAAIALYDYFLAQCVGEMGIPVLAIAGNHDSPSRLQFGSSLYRSSGYHIVGVPEEKLVSVSLRDAYGEVCFSLVPYLHIAEAKAMFPEEEIRTFDAAYQALLAKNQPPKGGARHVAVAHGYFSGLSAEKNRELITSDSEIGIGGMDLVDTSCFDGFSYVALGHLHAPQRCGGNARYSGSPLKYSLSEEKQKKSITIIELDAAGKAAVTAVPVPALRDVRTVRGKMDELMEPSFHKNKSFHDYVFAEIVGEECLFPMQKLRTLFPNLLGLRFLSHELPGAAGLPQGAGKKIARYSMEDLFRRFYLDCAAKELPEPHLQVLREAMQEMAEEEEGQ